MKAPPIDTKDLFKVVTENSEYGRTVFSYILTTNLEKPNDIDSVQKRFEEYKETEKDFITKCVEGKVSKTDCQRAWTNGIWQACQSLKKPPKFCKSASYWITAKDVFTSSYFWGPVGLFLGILMVTVAFLLLYCLFLRKRNKGMAAMTGEKGGKKEIKADGGGKAKGKESGSQETPTPGSGNQKSKSAESGNGKKHIPGISPNKETYMY